MPADDQRMQDQTELRCLEDLSMDSVLLAVAEQSLEKLTSCISAGCNLNDTPVAGCTPLLLAVKLGALEMVKMLLQNGASAEADTNGMTLLHHAALNGFAEIAKYLVESGAVIDQQNIAGCTPLYQAVQHGHSDCVRTFLDMKADIEVQTRSGATPLYIASDKGHVSLATELLDAGADANAKTNMQMTPLLVAAFNGHAPVVRLLVSHGVDIEQRGPGGGTPLYVAAQEGRRSVAEFLIEQGAVVDSRCDGEADLTPSLIAAMQGHDDLLRLLLEAKGDADVRTGNGSTLAKIASGHGRTGILKMLVGFRGPTVFDDQSVLAASKTGHHTETSSYIEAVITAQKQADLSAWEASLPGLLEELDPPCKKQGKGKSKQKKKANAKRASKSEEGGPLDVAPDVHLPIDGVVVSENADDGTNAAEDAPCNRGSIAVTHVDRHQEEDIIGGPWTQVTHRRIAKPVIAIASHESPLLLPHEQAAPTLSPLATLSDPGPVTPLSSQALTPCGTTSPFGLRTVLPPWPSTPESWPHFEEHLGSAFWPILPPAAVNVDTVFTMPERVYSGTCHQNVQPPSHANLPVNAAKCGQSLLVPTWPQHNVVGLSGCAGIELT